MMMATQQASAHSARDSAHAVLTNTASALGHTQYPVASSPAADTLAPSAAASAASLHPLSAMIAMEMKTPMEPTMKTAPYVACGNDHHQRGRRLNARRAGFPQQA